MCQLLGVSYNKPTAFNRLFAEFRKRGRGNPHAWGAAWWAGDGRGPAVVREARPAHESALAASLAAAETPAVVAIAHVRLGTTPGEGSLKATTNAHPFLYRVGGRDWAFAHNGWIRWVGAAPRRRPEGTTDSERFFALLADAMEDAAAQGEPLENVMAAKAALYMKCGKLNFLASDGERLFFFASHPAEAGGLFWRVAGSRRNAAAVVATRPLFTEEGWTPVEPGTLYVADRGRVAKVARAAAARSLGRSLPQRPRPAGSLKVPRQRSLIDWLEDEIKGAV